MSKGKVQVSDEFAKFYGKNAVALEDAKKAENQMSSGPCPVGWEGKCILLEAAAEVGKPKKDDKGNVIPGNPRVRMKFDIVDDERYSGKAFTKYWIFNKTANMDAAGRYAMFLNDCERMGVPRDLRENHETAADILNYLVEGEFVFDVRCDSDDYSQDKKKMVVFMGEAPVDESNSMSPDSYSSKEEAPSVPQDIKAGFAKGDKVIFLNNEWVVAEVSGEELVIERDDNGRIRSRDVKATAVKPA